jgi:hypothetical protein
MITFLRKFEEKIARMETLFDDDVKRNASLNKFLYEYEAFSVKAYGHLPNKPKQKKTNLM